MTDEPQDAPVETAEPIADPPVGRRPGREGGAHGESDVGLLEREGDIAADYLEGLLDIADLDGDIDIDVEGNRAAVSIVGADLSSLVGAEGATLEALQELTRLAVHRETGVRSRLMLDIGGHRARRREELTILGTRTAEAVRDSTEPVRLDPMTPFERKVVHDAVSAVDGVLSESEGEEPQRRIVVRPA
ncbi:MAG: spoIIIJ-associated protein [Frankiaceae bacterium]|nr:spoIIIJ-associated protein [Frankiaceae bacterium]